MINTIFYFVPTLLEYQAKYNSGEIASRTIVFVEDNRSIYKDGIRYGGYNEQELIDIIDGKIDPLITNIGYALELISQLNDHLDTFIEDKKQEIKDVIDDTLDEYEWLKKNLGDVFAYQGFVDELNGFLTAVGVIKENSAAWSTLLLTINSITGRIVNIENGTTLEVLIKGWIAEGISGIDLSTYALKGDLEEYLKTGELNRELEGTSAFLQLRSDIDGAMAAIGAWSQYHQNDTITNLLGLLLIDVNNLTNTVTTELSSTIRQYLGNDLETAVNLYLLNQSGLILLSNLDGAVANLFALSTKSQTENAVDGVVQLLTAGFIAKTDLGTGTAAATVYATDGDLVASITAGIIANMSNPTVANLGQSFIDAIADNFNVHGTLNIVNSSDKKVAYIDKNGHASFIDGHIYIPYNSTNWTTMQDEADIVGLYVDSVAKESNDATYATSHWGANFRPRTLIEPDGLRFENNTKARTGVVKTGFVRKQDEYDSNETIDTYILDVRAYDPLHDLDNNADKGFCGISMQPSLVRSGHESSGGYMRIENHKRGDADNDPSTWTGKLHATQFHSIEMEAADEIILISNGNGNGLTLKGNHITFSNIAETSIYSWDHAGSWTTSDERIKTIMSNAELPIEDIAATRLVNFTFNGDETNTVHTGSIAQDWQNIIPNAVTEKDGKLLLDYTVVATAASITAAREIVKLKQENEDLKKRLAAIEAKLGIV